MTSIPWYYFSYKEVEKKRLSKLDYRPTWKIAQIETEIKILDKIIKAKLDPVEDN